ncbi:alpha-(1-_3)-arabinofuranosyltransferase domain-containing protein [Janibacter hoylei]|uniref:alpha-(1->3)-arabinofuranosyltransferase domain-containing protein n=1 Tax=Janibacter hoylei TaxID=364298 RepID=UPI0027B90E15|nr:alpha-(1->3)-arabinofuranosyltransferase family protein [Janibacter hoylei]
MPARSTALRAAHLAALAVLALVVFGNAYGHFHTDIKPEVYVSPGRMLQQYLSSWSTTPYLGAANFNVGLVPVLVWTALLRLVGFSPELTFKIFHFVLWVIGARGAGRLLRELVPKVSPWSVFVTSVVFLANPYAVTGGSTLAIALPMCLLPWMLVALIKALRDPTSWVWPACVGLLFFAMSGMNVAVVPIYQLLMAIPVVLVLRRAWSLRWSAVASVVAKCGAFVLGLSLYWLVPSFAAQGTGAQVVRGSETLDGIARVSSYLEVLRGLGMWTLYGRSDAGPWVPQYAIYITAAFVVVLTVLWPAMALWSLRWTPPTVTRIAAVSVAIAAVIMVGLFPGDPSAPAGAVMEWAFEHVPGAVAFRTSNKIGAVLALAFALTIGLGAHHIASRVRAVPGLRQLSVGGAFVLVIAWAAPAFTGNLYISEFDVPDYWHQAADRVNESSSDHRVLLLPGQVRPYYRWSQERPDDVSNSLITRDTVIPETTSSTSAGGANFLNALDDTVQSETSVNSAVSTYARYLGVDQILLRHDIVWEDAGGARPGSTARVLAGDPGLFGQANFGESGRNILPPSIAPEDYRESLLHPVQLYDVDEPVSTVRVSPTKGSLLVAGDAWALPPLTDEGLLRDTPLFRYTSDVDDDDFATAVEDAGRIVLTDTNRRRASITNRLTSGNGPLLTEDETPELTRALGTPDDQTVLRRSGILAKASEEGATFFEMPSAVAENAVDGNPSTSWIFGDFRRAPGMSLDLTLPQSERLDTVTISQADLGPVGIDEVELTAGGRTVTGRFPAKGDLQLDLDGVDARTARLEVKSLKGDGFNLVGISEIDLGTDEVAERTARLPRSLDQKYSRLTPRERQSFGEVPLDIYLNRVINTPTGRDDSESDLRRDFTVPDDRLMQLSAKVRLGDDWEEVYDRLGGVSTGPTFRSASVFFNNADLRASRAADDDAETAWVPGGGMEGEWWEATAPDTTTFDEVRITQADGFGATADDTRFASEVEVTVDGKPAGTGTVRRGTSTVALDRPVRGKRIRVEVTDTRGGDEATNARFTTIDAGLGQAARTGTARGCLTVATLDGKPVRMRPADASAVAVSDSVGAAWVGCERLDLSWGEHRLRPVDDVTLDSLTMRDTSGLKTTAAASAPTSQIDQHAGGGATVRTGAGKGSYAVVLGQGYDSRWTATMDGTDLGTPVQLDGYSVGWIIDDPSQAHEIEISFAPQRSATIALLVSTTVLVLAFYLVGAHLWSLRQRRREEAAAAPTPETGAGTDFADGHDDGLEARRATTTTEVVAPEEDPVNDPLARSATGGRHGRPRRRALVETLVVLGSGLLVGWPGLLVAAIAVALVRLRGVRAERLIDAGVVLVIAAALWFVVGPGNTGGEVSADAISASMWPHRLAGGGLVLAVLGGLLRSEQQLQSLTTKERHGPA